MDEASVRIEADPERVWNLVTDITAMGAWSPENTGGRWLGRATGPARGARFIGFNRHGWVRWFTTCRVVESVRPERFSFTVDQNGMTWGWRIAPDGDATVLTQWRERTGRIPLLARAFVATGLAGRDREPMMVNGMQRTLDAIKRHLERAPA